MERVFLSPPNSFLPSSYSAQSSCSTPFSSPSRCNVKRYAILCKTLNGESHSRLVCSRRGLSASFITGFVFSFGAGERLWNAKAVILEADEDDELMERIKKDRKKRIERQSVISSSDKEKGYLQDLIYQLSKIGQAIDNNDLLTASSVLGGSTETEWVKKANLAFSKLSSNPEEKTRVDTFNSSLASLISSVSKNDVESSKIAFVSSARAFEEWTNLTGLVDQLKGL